MTARACIALVSAVCLSACGEDVTGEDATGPAPVDRVEVTPQDVRLEAIGAAADFEAEAVDKNGNTVNGANVRWESKDSSIVAIDSTGTAVGRSEGRTHIVAETNGVRDSSSFRLVGRGRIAYASYRNGNYEIYTIQENGSNRQRLTNHSEADFAPTWSPDGSSIAFLSKRAPAGLYRMSADGSNIRLVSDRAFTGVARPEWSPDGSRIAFRTEDDKLATVRPDGTGYQVIVSFDVSFGRLPTWSPNSETLAFVYDRVGEIWTADVSTSDRESLEVWGSQPKWSSAAGKIAFFSYSSTEISTMNPDGSEIRSIAPGYDPTWSPRDHWVAFFNEGDLIRVRRSGSSQTTVLSGGSLWKTPAWRPLPSN